MTAYRSSTGYRSATPYAGTSGSVAGDVAATIPAHTAAIAGTVTVVGSVAATIPAHTALVTDIAGLVAGSLTPTRAPHQASVVALVTTGAILPWVADESQAAQVEVDTPGGALLLLPPVAVTPADIVERQIVRESHIMPTLTIDAAGRVRTDGTHEVIPGTVGTPHLFVSGRDVTYWGGVPVKIGELTASQPGGDETASVDFPWLTPFHETGVGDLAWLRPDAKVEVYMVDSEGSRVGPCLFAGNLVSDNAGHDEGSFNNGWHIEGALSQLDYVGHKVPTILNPDPFDVGRLIAKLGTNFVSRRFVAIKPFVTNITTRARGSYRQTEWDYIQSLLATAWKTNGQQLTLKRDLGSVPRNYQLGWKDITTVHHTIDAGAPGVTIDLTRDFASSVNCIYGSGVGPDGYPWAGWVYPRLHSDTAPAYPYAFAGTVMSIGSTDGGTLTGDGVSAWQRRVNSVGKRADVPVDGVFSAQDADAARGVQRQYGLTVDGIVGPQTWNATFGVGSNAGSLWGARREPLAIHPSVERYRYTASGALNGFSPTYDPTVIRREIDIDYGAGVTKAEAIRSAQAQLARDLEPGWVGTIELRSDPHEGSRWFIFEGQNVLVRGFRGQNLLMHVVETRKNPGDDALTVTLTVDTKARDAMTLSSILGRDRDSKVDPARRPGNVNRRSRSEQDMTVEFDGESGAGQIERMALYGGLWTVINIPLSQVGRLSKVTAQTFGPAKFAMALFGAPIQPSHLRRYVGNPLASDDPFGGSDTAVLDDRFGFIEGWGQKGQACGYGRKSEGSGPLTGAFAVDGGGVEYRSTKGGWVWVALYAQTSCFIEGRIYPAPVL